MTPTVTLKAKREGHVVDYFYDGLPVEVEAEFESMLETDMRLVSVLLMELCTKHRFDLAFTNA